jgi:pimeloyl-ACP methyl ester carboxylesterase
VLVILLAHTGAIWQLAGLRIGGRRWASIAVAVVSPAPVVTLAPTSSPAQAPRSAVCAKTDSARFIAQHIVDPQVWELPGVGHFAPVLAPESIAEELITFFESARQPA